MLYNNGDKRVEIEPFQALTKAYKKYVVLFLAFISPFFFVSVAFAKEPQAPNKQDSKTITVLAVVPLTPEFVYSIKKNSSLKLTKAAFALGEEVRVQVKIAGGHNFPLRGHKVNLQVINKQGKTPLVFSGETDNDGLTYFSFFADENLFGKNILRVVDITYDEPIVISQEKVFIVYKPSDGRRDRELAEQKIIIRKSVTSERFSLNETQKFAADENALQNNGTIIAYAEIQSPNKWSNDP